MNSLANLSIARVIAGRLKRMAEGSRGRCLAVNKSIVRDVARYGVSVRLAGKILASVLERLGFEQVSARTFRTCNSGVIEWLRSASVDDIASEIARMFGMSARLTYVDVVRIAQNVLSRHGLDDVGYALSVAKYLAGEFSSEFRDVMPSYVAPLVVHAACLAECSRINVCDACATEARHIVGASKKNGATGRLVPIFVREVARGCAKRGLRVAAMYGLSPRCGFDEVINRVVEAVERYRSYRSVALGVARGFARLITTRAANVQLGEVLRRFGIGRTKPGYVVSSIMYDVQRALASCF